MPQYFYVEEGIGTKYFACTAAQDASTETPDTEVGAWTTSLATAKANAFNTNETGARERVDVFMRFGALYKELDDADAPNVEYKITIYGSDDPTDTTNHPWVSQGAQEVKNLTPTLGTISGTPTEIDSGGTITDGKYNFSLKKKFFYLQVIMKVSAYIQAGVDNGIDIYGFVSLSENGITRANYKTKTFMHGHGLQVMTGPKSYARFGRNQNLIFGDLNIEGDAEGGGGGYFEKNLTVGTNEKISTHPLYVVGDIAATGNVIAYVSSDERLKTAITPLENSLEKIKNLNPIDFAWKSRDVGWGTESPADMGLLAQDVEKQFPTIVKEMKDGYKGIRYDRLIPVLVDCIKTQDSKIEELKELVEKMIDRTKEE